LNFARNYYGLNKQAGPANFSGFTRMIDYLKSLDTKVTFFSSYAKAPEDFDKQQATFVLQRTNDRYVHSSYSKLSINPDSFIGVVHESISEPLFLEYSDIEQSPHCAAHFVAHSIANGHFALSDERGTGIHNSVGTSTLDNEVLQEMYYDLVGSGSHSRPPAHFFLTTISRESDQEETDSPLATDDSVYEPSDDILVRS
ncbi:MAG: hypothetical protein KDD62_04690, partial [Bdellovibrionales bacterium]|nr:hypothetical protein [Bdellovibrionales bacterium]